jgi:hypothetical protein
VQRRLRGSQALLFRPSLDEFDTLDERYQRTSTDGESGDLLAINIYNVEEEMVML